MTLAIIIGIILVGLVFLVWGYDRMVRPQADIDPAAFDDVRFPTVRGSNLSRENFTLPDDIEGEYALLMIAFQQVQQFDINTWLPVARQFAETYDGMVYYELPTIDRLNPAARAFIDGGMRAGIPDPIARSITITLYLDKPAFREVLDIPDEDSIVVMLINRDGEIFWRTDGRASEPAVEELESVLADLLR